MVRISEIGLKQWIKNFFQNLYWCLWGRTIKNPPLPCCPKSFLFLCKGNICRSPFAEKLAARMAQTHCCGNDRVFASAGLSDVVAEPPPPLALEAAADHAVSLFGHLSKKLDSRVVYDFDIIIVMEAKQLRILRRLFPQLRGKLFLLPLFNKKYSNLKNSFLQYNIRDPYGCGLREFKVCYERIEACLTWMFTVIFEQPHRTDRG